MTASNDRRAEWKKYRATQLAWALERGRCTRCKKDRATEGKRTCEPCRIRFRDEMQARKAKARADGMCTRCEKVPVSDSVRCDSCADVCYRYDSDRRQRARISGRCIRCFERAPDAGLLTCRVCIDTTAANNKARKLARKEATK